MSTLEARVTEKPALLGGPKAVTRDPGDMFDWPIVTEEDEQAVLEVLRRRAMSFVDVTQQFEKEFAEWIGAAHALGACNGTAALQTAMWAVGVREKDEVICPAMTYWASGLPALTLGAAPVWADIDPETLCLDAASAAERITDRTKAIVVVHYAGYPADMDPILDLAAKHDLKVIEDVSHAHGGIYKGRKLGTIGDVGAMSCMSGKAFAIGEAGMLVTNDRGVYERALLWGHYARHDELTDPELKELSGLPFGAVKHRMHQVSSAMGRVQLRHYAERNAEILKAMHYFWDALEGTPGVRAHRPAKDSGSEMGGWYAAEGLYRSEELGGLPCDRFVEALVAEGAPCVVGANPPLHLFEGIHVAEIYADGQPTFLANATRDVRAPAGSLPVTESIKQIAFRVPWFKHHRPEIIDEYVLAVKKVAAHAGDLGQ